MGDLHTKSEKSLHIATLPLRGITTSMGEKFAYEKKEVKSTTRKKEVKSTTYKRSTSEVKSTSSKKTWEKKIMSKKIVVENKGSKEVKTFEKKEVKINQTEALKKVKEQDKMKKENKLYNDSLVMISKNKTEKDVAVYIELPSDVVIAWAKDLNKAEVKLITERQEREALSRKIEKDFASYARPKMKALIESTSGLQDLVQASLLNLPQKDFTFTEKINQGNLIYKVSAFQNVDKPEVKNMTEAQKALQGLVTNMVTTFGKKRIIDYLIEKSGTRLQFVHGVMKKTKNQKLKKDKAMTDEQKRDITFKNLPLHIGDFAYQLSVGLEKTLPIED